MRIRATIAAVLLGILVEMPAPSAASPHTTIWSGVFTEAQATRGEQAFMATCASCHLEDLSGRNGPALKGTRFVEKWREADLSILFNVVKSMPPSTPRNPRPRLPETTSLDILAHLLRANGAPAGAVTLAADALPTIQFEKQTGPEPVPNLTLVRLVGCIAKPAQAWTITGATEPARSMDPDVLSVSDKAWAGTAPRGSASYTLSQVDYIDTPIAGFLGHTVLIKGTLVRQEQGARINLTALESLDSTCR